MSPARRGITLPQPPWGRGPAADLIPFLLLQCVARDSLANPECGHLMRRNINMAANTH